MPRPLRALVLGAGGYAAMSWEVGFLAGMAHLSTYDAPRWTVHLTSAPFW